MSKGKLKCKGVVRIAKVSACVCEQSLPFTSPHYQQAYIFLRSSVSVLAIY